MSGGKKCQIVGLLVAPEKDCPDCASARGEERAAEGAGPAKVTTDAYRSGWDLAFGRQTRGQA